MWQPPSEPSKRKTLVFPLSFIPGPSVSTAHAPFLFYQCDASPVLTNTSVNEQTASKEGGNLFLPTEGW